MLLQHPIATNGWILPLPLRTTARLFSSSSMADDTATTAVPQLPLPEPICSDTPGTWAYDTMSRRVNEEILERTVQDIKEDLEKPAFAPIKERIEKLRQNLATSSKHLRMVSPFFE